MRIENTEITGTWDDLRILLRAGIDADTIRACVARRGSLADIAWEHGDREDERLHEIAHWPWCTCTCDCDEAATTTDDGGGEVCDACSRYAIDKDGEVVCSRSGLTEEISESCGAGGQMRTYTRIIPPEFPPADEAGDYAVWWETVGDDSHIVARYSTAQDAARAVDAHDWPPPGDRTAYLCGYAVRVWVDGRWVPYNEEEP